AALALSGTAKVRRSWEGPLPYPTWPLDATRADPCTKVPCRQRGQHNGHVSDGGARHWAIVASLVASAKLNGVEPLAWLTDVLERVVSGRTKAHELERLLPWNWKAERAGVDLKAAA